MANPFEGIITAEFKTLFTNAIDSLLESTACTVECRLIFEVTRWNTTNNTPKIVGGRSTNYFRSGGAAPSTVGNSPSSFAQARIPDQQTETIHLVPIWNYKDWLGGVKVHSPEGMVQTVSKIDTLDNIKRANEIEIDVAISKYGKNIFQRLGNPNPIGLGASSYVLTMWERKR